MNFSKIRLRLFQLFSFLVVAALSWLVFRNKSGFNTFVVDFIFVWDEFIVGILQYSILFLVFLMMIVNWSLEALKWKLISRNLQKLSFGKSLQSVLAGLAVGFFVPNRVGEFAGKSLMLPKSDFWKATVLAIYTSLAQLFTTVFWGMLAFWIFSDLVSVFLPINIKAFAFALFLIVVAVLIIVYLKFEKIANVFTRFKKLYEQISILEKISLKSKSYLLLLSFMRFFVFSLQYILLIYLLGIEVPLIASFLLISLLYLALMIIPTIAITELPARSLIIALLFSAWYDSQSLLLPEALEIKLILASTLIWLINIAMPALIGALFIPSFSIFYKKK